MLIVLDMMNTFKRDNAIFIAIISLREYLDVTVEQLSRMQVLQSLK